jgi:hypothetical protein
MPGSYHQISPLHRARLVRFVVTEQGPVGGLSYPYPLQGVHLETGAHAVDGELLLILGHIIY